MDRSLFGYILRHSRPQQIWLTFVICLYFPIQYVSLELPKLIIDEAIGAEAGGPYPIRLLGFIQFQIDATQLTFLWLLCGAYLFFVVFNNGIKYYINVYAGRLSERMLRRMRYELYERLLCFPLGHFRRTSQGEIIPMITQELEPVGGFAGVAFSEPIYKGGMLLVLLGFMMAQDVILGLAAIALFPFQMWLVPKLQANVNRLSKRRVREVRRLADQIGETVAAITEIRGNDAGRYERARFTARLGKIYWIRYEIYLKKFFIKFLNNFIDKLTPFFFFSIGGWLVLEGQVTLGALTGVLLAYKDVSAPWKELLAWYQQKEDARIKFEQVVSQFDPADAKPVDSLNADPPADFSPTDPIRVISARLEDDTGNAVLQGVDLELPTDRAIALVGPAGGGKAELALVLAGLANPQAGAVTWGGRNMVDLPMSVMGREIAFVASHPTLATGTITDNLMFGLRHRIVAPPDYTPQQALERAREALEAAAAGNSPDDVDALWLDLARAGVTDRLALIRREVEVLGLVELDDDVYTLGLRGVVDLSERPEIADKVLIARRAMRERLRAPEYEGLVEPFDETRYNLNATVAENLLYGAPLGDQFRLNALATQPFLRGLLQELGLDRDLMAAGRVLAQTMVELFADLPPGHEFFSRFSFIESENLPRFQSIISRSETGLAALSEEERSLLLGLPLRLIPAVHRLGIVDQALQDKILVARAALRRRLPPDLTGEIAFFDAERYNPGASVQDNILFGKLIQARAGAAQQIGTLVRALLEELSMREAVIEVGLGLHVGVAASGLTSIQRQKLALARALIRRPRLLIVEEALSGLDRAAQDRIIQAVLRDRTGLGVIWVPIQPDQSGYFDRVITIAEGRVAKDHVPGSLDQEDAAQ